MLKHLSPNVTKAGHMISVRVAFGFVTTTLRPPLHAILTRVHLLLPSRSGTVSVLFTAN